MIIFFRCELKGRYFKFLCISDVDDSEKPLDMQTSKLKDYINDTNYIIKKLIVFNRTSSYNMYTLMGLNRLKVFFEYYNESLRNMNITTTNKASILSIINKSFKSMSQIWDKADLTYETFLLNKTVNAMLEDFDVDFHYSHSSGTFNQRIFNVYVSSILQFYFLETMISNTYDNIKEILNAGKF